MTEHPFHQVLIPKSMGHTMGTRKALLEKSNDRLKGRGLLARHSNGLTPSQFFKQTKKSPV